MFIKFGEILAIIFYIFVSVLHVLSFEDSYSTHVRPCRVVPQHTGAVLFSVCFVLEGFIAVLIY